MAFGRNGRQPESWHTYEKIHLSARSGIPSSPSSPHFCSFGGSGVFAGGGGGGGLSGGGLSAFSSFGRIGFGDCSDFIEVGSCILSFSVGTSGGLSHSGSFLGSINGSGSDFMHSLLWFGLRFF